MAAILRLTHKSIGAEVRRKPYQIELDGENAGSVEMNQSIDIPIPAGMHTLSIHCGRDASKAVTFTASDGEIVSYRCTGKRFVPLFLASFVDPDLALVLIPEGEIEGEAG